MYMYVYMLHKNKCMLYKYLYIYILYKKVFMLYKYVYMLYK